MDLRRREWGLEDFPGRGIRFHASFGHDLLAVDEDVLDSGRLPVGDGARIVVVHCVPVEYRDVCRKITDGKASGILSFGIEGGQAAGAKFIDALQMILRLVNIGDAKSLACHPTIS